MSVVGSNALAGASGQAGAAGYQIERSLRFNDDDSASLSRTPSSEGNRKTWTWSGWLKRCQDTSLNQNFWSIREDGNNMHYIRFDTTGQLRAELQVSASKKYELITTAVFRDFSAWYHVVLVFDSTQSTASDRVKLYVNNTQITTFSTETYPSQNQDGLMNKTVAHYISDRGNGINYFDGYMAEIHFIDGQALAPTDFGEYDDDNNWNPKEFQGSHNVTVAAAYTGTVPTSTSDVPPAGGYGNGIATAAVLFGGTELTNGQNHIRQDGGGIEWSAAITLSSGDVAGAKCLYFNNTSTHNIEFKINGSWVTAQTAANNVIGTSSALITYTITGVGTSSWTGVRATGGSNISVTTVAGIFVNGNLVGETSTVGVNGFHLKFADNSSAAALGTDSSGNNNTWTVNNLQASAGASSDALTAVSFDGVDDKLTLGTDSNLSLSGVFTLEAWIYRVGTNNEVGIFEGSAGGVGSCVVRVASNKLGLERHNTAFDILSSGTVPTDQWVHVAITRDSSNTCRAFINGTLDGTSTSNTYGYSGDFRVGQSNNGYWESAVSNLRLIKGTCLYTSNFTPPTTPLSNVTNTVLLICQDSSSATAATVKPSGTTIGTGGSPTAGSYPSVPAADVDSLIDTPTNYTASSGNNGGNYATWNPLQKYAAFTLSNGNLDFTDNNTVGGGDQGVHATIAPVSGKFYWEMTLSTLASENYIGISKTNKLTQTLWTGGGVDGYYYYNNGNKIGGGNGNGGQSYGASFGAGDVIGVAVDWDNGKVTFYKNGTSQGDAFTGKDLTGYVPAFYFNTNQSAAGVVNFGQRPFAYTPPTDYVTLCTQNLPDPTIADGSTAFEAITYSGNSSTQVINTSFSADFIWTKVRNDTYRNALLDIIRGGSGLLHSDRTLAENTSTQIISNFGSSSYTLTNDPNVNQTNKNYVAWAWDAGTSNTSISAGGLNSSVYNQSQTWSNDLASDNGNYFGTHTPDKAFDGDTTSTKCTSSSAPGTLTLDLSNNNLTGTLEVLAYTGMSIAVTHSGGTTTIAGGTSSANFGSLTSISQIVVTGVSSSYNAQLFGIKLNGALLVDSGVSVTNVPSIASTVRANPSAGFSIVSWPGTSANATVGHGLNAAPEFIITKVRGSTSNWYCYHTGLTDATKYIWLNSGAAEGTQTAAWNSTAPTSSVIHVGGEAEVNRNGYNTIAYCISPVAGYSAVGSYTGNGSADGPFIYTGFRVRYLLQKRVDSSGSWAIKDAAREPHNVVDTRLYADASNADMTQSSFHEVDFLSNGFKVRSPGGSEDNASGGTFVYLAFASHPFKTARAR